MTSFTYIFIRHFVIFRLFSITFVYSCMFPLSLVLSCLIPFIPSFGYYFPFLLFLVKSGWLKVFSKSDFHSTVCFFGQNMGLLFTLWDRKWFSAKEIPWQLTDHGKFSVAACYHLKKMLLIQDVQALCQDILQICPEKICSARKNDVLSCIFSAASFTRPRGGTIAMTLLAKQLFEILMLSNLGVPNLEECKSHNTLFAAVGRESRKPLKVVKSL